MDEENNQEETENYMQAEEKEKPIGLAKVAYVKDSGNREVINIGSNRYDGSSSVSQIEIITTEEMYNTLADTYKDGYMFNLMYE